MREYWAVYACGHRDATAASEACKYLAVRELLAVSPMDCAEWRGRQSTRISKNMPWGTFQEADALEWK